MLALQLDRSRLTSTSEYYANMAANIREMMEIIRAADTKVERVGSTAVEKLFGLVLEVLRDCCRPVLIFNVMNSICC